ncbi:MAG: aldehyde dehydrogenase family protein [Phycisphaerales bacterium]
MARVPLGGSTETERAVSAAHDAWLKWRGTTANERASLIDKLRGPDAPRCRPARTPDDRRAVQATRRVQGRDRVRRLVPRLGRRRSQPHLRRDHPRLRPQHQRILVFRQPVGVCANHHAMELPECDDHANWGPPCCRLYGCDQARRGYPACAAIALGEPLEAGIPAGVSISSWRSLAIGGLLTSDQRVRKLSFTGSTEVGRLLMKQSSDNLLRLSMELGGHAPFIVFDDADMSKAAEAAMACKFRNAGQTCICANRFYVHESVHTDFVSRLSSAIGALRVGDGTQEGVNVGPLINDEAITKVESHVADAREKGASVLLGGQRVRIKGLADRFYAPTLIDGMTADMRVHHEETFGPVAAVRSFRTEEEVVEWANSSQFGLAAYFFTQNASRLIRVAERLEYGIVGANDGGPSTVQAPFGGVKQSGFGREGGKYVMDEYTQLKYISWGV